MVQTCTWCAVSVPLSLSLYLSFILLRFIFNYDVHVCIYVCRYMHIDYRWPQRSEASNRPVVEVMGSCEPPDMGVRN